jgi:ribonuclease HII
MWKGDEVAACVAAASIVAKVTRDRIMTGLADQYPAYGFEQHKGYSTRSHMRALAEHGPCPEHRASFANVMGLARDIDEPPGGWVEDAPAADGPLSPDDAELRSGELHGEELTYR